MENGKKMYFNYDATVNAVLFADEVDENGEVVRVTPIKSDFESIEDLVITIKNYSIENNVYLRVTFTTNPGHFLRYADDEEIVFSSFDVDDNDYKKTTEEFSREIEDYILDSLVVYAKLFYEIDEEKGKYERIRIRGLLGKYDVSIKLMDSIVILIGANGVGKSTIIRFIDYFLNRRFDELAKIPFDSMDYMLFDDCSAFFDLKVGGIITVISSYDLVPTEDYLIEQYQKTVWTDVQMPDYEDFLNLDNLYNAEEIDYFKEFISVLKKENLYIQFINVLLKNVLPSPRLSNIISKYYKLDRLLKYNIIEIKQYQRGFVIEGSPASNLIKKYKNIDVFTPHNNLTFYVDMVQNLMLDGEHIKASLWRNLEIDWISAPQKQIKSYESIFDTPQVYYLDYNEFLPITDRFDTRPTPICKARPELDIGIDNYKDVYKKIVTQLFDENNIFYSEIGTRMGIRNAQKMVYIDEVYRLIAERKFNINKMINVFYCNPEIIHIVNKHSQEYTKKYFEMIESIQYEFLDVICKEITIELRRFQTEFLDDYARYINPILVKNSFFYVNTEKLAEKNSVDFYKRDTDSLKESSLVRNGHIEFCLGWYKQFDASKTIYEDYCYIKQLNEFAKRVIPLLKDDSCKTDRTKYFEKSLRKYFIDKKIFVSPSGLSIYASVMNSDDNIKVTVYDEDEINLTLISSGEKKIITLFALVSYFTDILILLDEPELSLSIVWQEMIMRDLAENRFGNRIVIATHSPYLVKDPTIQEKVIFLPQAKMEYEDE